jgi:hypothetical protein
VRAKEHSCKELIFQCPNPTAEDTNEPEERYPGKRPQLDGEVDRDPLGQSRSSRRPVDLTCAPTGLPAVVAIVIPQDLTEEPRVAFFSSALFACLFLRREELCLGRPHGVFSPWNAFNDACGGPAQAQNKHPFVG